MRVLYLGMAGEFSRIPLQALLEAGMEICAVVTAASSQGSGERPLRPVPAPVSSTQEGNPPASIIQQAWKRRIPVFEMHHSSHPETLRALRELQADVACVACFSKVLPPALLAVPRWGFLNLHPSLLPEYRGPEPLFWAFRHGKQQTGVTVHVMEENVDAGDIICQAPVVLPDGISGREAERLCAGVGADLLVDIVTALEGGTPVRRTEQGSGNYYPAPSAVDFQIPLTWSARHAFNFMRGTREWRRPYPLAGLPEEFLLTTAVSYHESGELGQQISRNGRQVWIQFNPGILQALTLY